MAATLKVSKPTIDIDTDFKDVQDVSEYADEIFNNLFVKEQKYRPNPDYMELQTDVNPRMRIILADWMYAVYLKFKSLPESYQLALALLDRFLSLFSSTHDNFQLIGITCLFIAMKLEEIYPPEVNDFVYISAQSYTEGQIIDMEKVIVDGLGFIIKTPLPIDFERRFNKAAVLDYKHHTMTKYLVTMCQLSVTSLRLLPSQLAAGATYLVSLMQKNNKELWSDDMVYYTHYSEEQARSFALSIQQILIIVQQSQRADSVIEFYSSRKGGEVTNYKYTIALPEVTNLSIYSPPPVEEPPINRLLRKKNKPTIPAREQVDELAEGISQLRFQNQKQLKSIAPPPTYAPSEWDEEED